MISAPLNSSHHRPFSSDKCQQSDSFKGNSNNLWLKINSAEVSLSLNIFNSVNVVKSVQQSCVRHETTFIVILLIRKMCQSHSRTTSTKLCSRIHPVKCESLNLWNTVLYIKLLMKTSVSTIRNFHCLPGNSWKEIITFSWIYIREKCSFNICLLFLFHLQLWKKTLNCAADLCFCHSLSRWNDGLSVTVVKKKYLLLFTQCEQGNLCLDALTFRCSDLSCTDAHVQVPHSSDTLTSCHMFYKKVIGNTLF